METHQTGHASSGAEGSDESRRGFLSKVSSAGMLAGLTASYGTAGVIAARYLYPAKPRVMGWKYVARVADIAVGGSLRYRTPIGEAVAIARQSAGTGAEDFIALSSTCPHLGCQVHWEGPQARFFCPCHNGTFDKSGVATGGPPGEAGMKLPRYPLKVEGGLLFIEVPTETLNATVASVEPWAVFEGCVVSTS